MYNSFNMSLLFCCRGEKFIFLFMLIMHRRGLCVCQFINIPDKVQRNAAQRRGGEPREEIILNGTYCDPKTNKPWNHGKIAKWKAYFPKKNLFFESNKKPHHWPTITYRGFF